jgi:PKD domain/Carboxypeptidase regulatory-like domain/Bacterial Ig-like domain
MWNTAAEELMNSRNLGLALGLLVLLVGCPDETKPPPVNKPPRAAFNVNSSVQAGTPLAFDASPSSDPDKDALAFSWDFGDGGRGGSSLLAHVFNSAGSFTVRLTATDPSGASSSSTKTITVSSRPAPGALVTVQGTVRDSSGAVLVGANVELVGGTAGILSDATGKVTLSLATGTPNTLQISKSGYAEQYKILELPPTASSGFFEVMLSQRAPDQTLDAGTGGSLSSSDGAKLTLSVGALVDGTGKPIAGSVNVNLTSIDVTDSSKVALFPGAFSGVLLSGSSSPIVSFGTTEYALSQAGARLQLASGKTASIEIPIFASLNLDGSSLKIGESQPLWSLDEKTGIWVQEGTGTVVASSASPSGLALRATVSHFSWWNADLGFDPSRPKPKCEPDQSIPGATSYFANETICNMIAEMDRGLGKTSSRAIPPRLPGYRASTTIPISGGAPLVIPANNNVILRGCALGGTWCGQVTVNKAIGSSDEVIIKLRPVDTSAISVAITSPTGTAYAGSSVTFKAVLNSGLLPDKLEFFKNDVSIGVAANSNFTWSTGSIPEGSYSITAKATIGAVTVTSAPITVIVDHGFPSLVSRSPAPAGIGSPSSAIQAVFSEPILTSSLTDTSVQLKVNDVVVGRSLSLSSDLKTLTITPSVALPVPANVSISFVYDSNSLTDLAGNVLIAATTPWTWTNSAWSPVGTSVEGNLKLSTPAPSMALGTDGQPFVAFVASANPSSSLTDLYVRHFEGSSWKDVGTPLSAVTGPGVFGYDQSGAGCPAIAVDGSSNPVVIWQELTEDNQTTYAYYVRRFNPNTASWEALGANGGKLPDFSYSACASPPSIRIDSSGRPVVAYTGFSGLLVKRFDGTNWVGLGPDDGNLGRLDFQGFNFVLNSADNPVLIGNEQNGFAVVKRFNSVSSLWENIGPYAGKLRAAGLTLSTPKLVIDASGNPLVAGTVSVPYGDSVTTQDITAFRFNGIDWQELGARAANYGVDVGQIATVAFDQDANPVMAYIGSTGDNYGLYVKRFNGSSWLGVGTSTGKVGVSAISSLGLGVNAGKLTLAFQGIYANTSGFSASISVIRYP